MIPTSPRFWLVGGAVGAVALTAVGWFGAIAPAYSQAGSLDEQTANASVQQVSLRHRLSELHDQAEKLPAFQAELDRDRQALPTSADMAAFLRELTDAGTAAGVSVTGVLAATPVPAAGSEAGKPDAAYAVPLTLTAAGSAANLSTLLDELQLVQPRAVLITQVDIAPDATGGTLDGAATLTVQLTAFVGPARR